MGSVIRKYLKPSLTFLVMFSILLGIIYPLLVTGILQTVFYQKANGSLILINKVPVGSSLIGQFFQDPKYLWGRVSNTEQFPYNGEFSGGSNLSVSNPALLKRISSTVSSYQTNNNNGKKIPVDLVTASASGLDPHITIAGAFYQIPRIANARHLDQQIIEDAINIYTEYRQFWILGEPRVNVVKVNLHLDRLQDLQ